MSERPASRQRTGGHLERRGRFWWHRFYETTVDSSTGEIRRRQRRTKLGRFRSEAEAARALARYLAQRDAEALAPGPRVTAREYFARFDRLQIALMRAQSRRAYRSTLRNHLEPALGDLLLSEIESTVCQELIAGLHAKGLAPATIASTWSRLREILRHARAAGFSAPVIARSAVKLPSASRADREQRHISAAELAQILDASTGQRRALYAILGLAGLRIGEALGLLWEHLDLAAGVILVRQAATEGEIAPLKTRTARRDVPMLPELQAILTAYRAQIGETAGLVFRTRTGRPLRATDIRHRWLRPLLQELHLAPSGCHGFRHGLPGRLDALGLSPAAIQRFMGHSTLTMTERYLHRSTADLREQLDAALRRGANSGAEKP